MWVAGLGDFEERTRSWVGEAEPKEIEGVFLRQSNKAGLHVARCETARRPGEACSALLPHLLSCG